ncbi:hypothetical protein M413DRAFT_238952 [Hebeloma cylindrosporum]|uniref:Uncharacterized protein n=1 Tax=Hebeloma cylindrosporum TaxID=76867 RepID=A0A0C3C3N0_HEBCY|nr:hypothetical protein M413DRAFT_238952 [Hebeloma cylindrosporum h7]
MDRRSFCVHLGGRRHVSLFTALTYVKLRPSLVALRIDLLWQRVEKEILESMEGKRRNALCEKCLEWDNHHIGPFVLEPGFVAFGFEFLRRRPLRQQRLSGRTNSEMKRKTTRCNHR